MHRLVVCCDGTWTRSAPDSNVRRLAEAYIPAADDQPAYYVPGVGMSALKVPSPWAQLTGAGLDRSIRDGYGWLAENFRPGDRICLFGFSRGAYTARSIAGMIARVGLVDGNSLGKQDPESAVRRAYNRYRNVRHAPGDVTWSAGLTFSFTAADDDIPVEFIGVWETIGALGIPAHFGVPDLWHSRTAYEFLDVELDPRIPHARHAVALDEMRESFRPTLWKEPAPDQDMRQIWFPGDHGDVGGGHPEKQLSDVTLQWMASEATAAVGLTFDFRKVRNFAPSPEGKEHLSATGPKGAVLEALFRPRPRAVPRVDAAHPNPRVSGSAHQRQRRTDYRATVTLGVGDTATRIVFADRAWTDTGLYLEAGKYRFSAAGRWSSMPGSCGPEGSTSSFPSPGRLSSRIIDCVQDHLRTALGNEKAALPGARRESAQPWMSLVGRVASEPDQTIPLGRGCDADVDRPGYLYAYPNDALGCYGNNAGAVSLTVERIG